MHEEKTLRQWLPEEVARWDEFLLKFFSKDYHLANFRRFARLAYWLAGKDKGWGSKQAPPDVDQMLSGIRRGGHIFDIAAGDAEPGAGMIGHLTEVGMENTRYLGTDIDTDKSKGPNTIDVLGWYLTKSSTSIYADEPADMYIGWSEAHVNRGNWQALRDRIDTAYGPEWDATDPGIFDRARQQLGGDIGLLMMRHPEIGDETQLELVPIFRKIIFNMLSEGISKGIPVLITTSTNPLSEKNIREAIDEFFASQLDYVRDGWVHQRVSDVEKIPYEPGWEHRQAAEQQQKAMANVFGTEPKKMKSLPRVLDTHLFVIYPKKVALVS